MKVLPTTRFFLRTLVVLMVAPCALPANAAEALIAKGAWARATAPGQTTASVYLELTSTRDAALVSAASPLAKQVEIHATRSEGGVMKMRPVTRVELAAGKSVKFAPGGLHFMLVGIHQPLREKERVPLALTVERSDGTRSTLNVEAEVRPIGAAAHHTH